MVQPALLFSLVLAGLLGCGEQPQIQTYDAPLDPRPELLVQRDGQMARTAQAQAGVQPEQSVTWTLPEGWRQTMHPSGDRLATLMAGEGDGALEVAITRFAGTGGDLLANLNRWAGQIDHPTPVREADLPNMLSPIDGTPIEGIFIDMTGNQRMVTAWFSDGHTSWFIKAQDADAKVVPHLPQIRELVQTFRPQDPHAGHDHADGHDHNHDHPAHAPAPPETLETPEAPEAAAPPQSTESTSSPESQVSTPSPAEDGRP